MITVLTNRITIDSYICHEKPCIRGKRWSVEVTLDMIESEMSFEEILSDHSEFEREDIIASLNYARLLVSGRALQNDTQKKFLRDVYISYKLCKFLESKGFGCICINRILENDIFLVI